MSPEQVIGAEIGPWTDLYATGVVAFELLVGAPPFEAPSVHETIAKHLREPPTPLRDIDPSIPESLEALVLQLLEKDPAQRPKSAAAVRRVLQQIERELGSSHTQGRGVRARLPPKTTAVPRAPDELATEQADPPFAPPSPTRAELDQRLAMLRHAAEQTLAGPALSAALGELDRISADPGSLAQRGKLLDRVEVRLSAR
jgi:serine/threonine protein kinase